MTDAGERDEYDPFEVLGREARELRNAAEQADRLAGDYETRAAQMRERAARRRAQAERVEAAIAQLTQQGVEIVAP